MIYKNDFRFFTPLISHFQFHSLISLFLFSMAFEKVLTLMFLVAVVLKSVNLSLKSFLLEKDAYGNWRTTSQDIQKSSLVWKYVFYKPLLSSKLLRSRALIIMLLITGCVEAHPGQSMSSNVGKFSYIFLYELEISQLSLVSCPSSQLHLRQQPIILSQNKLILVKRLVCLS